jgi:hypothetical protein
MAMIAMRMRDDYAIQLSDVRCKQLLAQIRPTIDKQTLAGALHQDRRP